MDRTTIAETVELDGGGNVIETAAPIKAEIEKVLGKTKRQKNPAKVKQPKQPKQPKAKKERKMSGKGALGVAALRILEETKAAMSFNDIFTRLVESKVMSAEQKDKLKLYFGLTDLVTSGFLTLTGETKRKRVYAIRATSTVAA